MCCISIFLVRSLNTVPAAGIYPDRSQDLIWPVLLSVLVPDSFWPVLLSNIYNINLVNDKDVFSLVLDC